MLTLMTALMLAQSSAPAVAAHCPYALIAGAPRSAKVSVYRTPTIAARKTGRLRPGTVVYICGETAAFVWVHYAEGRYSCRGGGNGLDGRAASTCANGWVEKRKIAIVAR